MITPSQRKTIDAIVSIFETGKLPSDAAYSAAVILDDGAGISFGFHQTTAASGLSALLEEYDRRGGIYARRLRPYLWQVHQTQSFRSDSVLPEWAVNLMTLLRLAGADPIMQEAQNELFDRAYWKPATAYAASIGLDLALSHLAVYDTWIHSGGGRVAELRRGFAELPPAKGGDEITWTVQFLEARKDWLERFTHKDAAKQRLVRSTVYRVDSLIKLAHAAAWDLTPPLVVRGVRLA